MRMTGVPPRDPAVEALPKREDALARATARLKASASILADAGDERAVDEVLAAAAELSELRRRARQWLTLPSLFPPSREEGGAHRECPCAGHKERRCLRCGLLCCPSCQPESGGSPCRRCGGPVWAEGEERTPARPNPAMGRY